MITSIVFDFSYVLLFAKDTTYKGKLNELNDKLSTNPDYEPLDFFAINSELIGFLKQFIDKYDFYIFTAGKMHKLPSLKNVLQTVFTNFLSETDVGFPKNDPKAFIKLSEMINVPVEEIMFIDDKMENVTAAQNAGMHSIQYLSNEQLSTELTKLL